MDVSLSEFREMVMDREAWRATIHGKESDTTEQLTLSLFFQSIKILTLTCGFIVLKFPYYKSIILTCFSLTEVNLTGTGTIFK